MVIENPQNTDDETLCTILPSWRLIMIMSILKAVRILAGKTNTNAHLFYFV